MSAKSSIQWTDRTWNPVRGCSLVSPGCTNCYAMKVAHRFSGNGQPYAGLTVLGKHGPRWSGSARFVPEMLGKPLEWRKPQRVFVNSMSDLFHGDVSDEQIAAVFGVMAACPQHTFQVLTKRPERMREWFAIEGIAERVDLFKHVAIAGRAEEYFASEREAPIAGWPGYFITSKGRVLTENGSDTCLLCGNPNEALIARRKFCSKQCASKAGYERRMGRWKEPVSRVEMKPMENEQGHSRVMLYRDDGSTERPLIHRLVLEAFDRAAVGDEQGCHIDGDATNNALWNLRWGSQSDNWEDRKRHGNGRSWSKLTEAEAHGIRESYRNGLSTAQIANSARFYGRITETQVRHIVNGEQWREHVAPEWPLPGLWLGVSCEDQKRADERIPLLLDCPAAVRFVSAEPLLGPIDLSRVRIPDAPSPPFSGHSLHECRGFGTKLDWVIVGGESGSGARICDVEWIRSIVKQCADAGTKCFVKQMGSASGVVGLGAYVARPTRDRKGGDISEFPSDLRIREFPR